MPIREIDPQPFYQLIHAALRLYASGAEQSRTTMTANWIEKHAATIERVFDRTEMSMLGLIMQYFRANETCPTRRQLKMLVEALPQPRLLRKMVMSLDTYPVSRLPPAGISLDDLLKLRIEDFERVRMITRLQNAIEIVDGSVEDHFATTKDAPRLSGVSDAHTYLMCVFGMGVTIDSEASHVSVATPPTPAEITRIVPTLAQVKIDARYFTRN